MTEASTLEEKHKELAFLLKNLKLDSPEEILKVKKELVNKGFILGLINQVLVELGKNVYESEQKISDIKKEEKTIYDLVPDRLKGFNFVLIDPHQGDGKKPMGMGWTKKVYRWGDEKLKNHLQNNHNYGIMGGVTSPVVINGKTYFLLIIDFDSKELQDKVLPLFPETFTTKSGGKGLYHLLVASDNCVSFNIRDEKDNVICDVQGEGKQIIGPGSIHKSGNRYEVVKDIPFAFVPYAQIEALLRPFDKRPKKEKTFKKEFIKNVSNDLTDRIVASVSMRSILDDLGVPTDRNPTECPFHASSHGQCFSWDDNFCHCFHCQSDHEGWNKFSLVKEAKRLTAKETFEWFARKANMWDEFEKAREEYKKNKIREQIQQTAQSPENTILPESNEVIIPHAGKLISSFADEVAQKIKNKNTIFFRTDSKEIVEIGTIKENEKIIYEGFREIKPNRFITIIEKYFTPGILVEDKKTKEIVFKPKSISGDLAKTLLESPNLQEVLQRIDRLFTVQIPIIYNGVLTFPKKGYDPNFKSWLLNDAPEITDPNMSLEGAKKIIKKVYSEFCFKSVQDETNAIAALLTPMLRGIFSKFCVRTPVFFYKANRERSGKEYCANITGIVYEGFAIEESPISSSDSQRSNNNDELRKKILSALMSGRKRLHFANNKGLIDNAVLEAIVTAEKYSDRVLGRNEILSFDNELDLSMSGNLGVSFTADLANRCRFINLFLEIEDANSRKFENPFLHDWIKLNRGLILSALYALIRNWLNNGKPKGKIPFTSFPEWAEVCGGIMESAGYESPCNPDMESAVLGSNSEEQDMKVLFELCSAYYPDKWIGRPQIMEVINSEEIFGYFDFEKKADNIKFGLKLGKFIGRIMSDIKLYVDNPNARTSRQKFKFSKIDQKSGIRGIDGIDYNQTLQKVEDYTISNIRQTDLKSMPSLPTMPKLTCPLCGSEDITDFNDMIFCNYCKRRYQKPFNSSKEFV